MKRLLIAGAAALLAGCPAIEPLKYDPVLASYLARAHVQSERAAMRCGDWPAWQREQEQVIGLVELATRYAALTADPLAVKVVADLRPLVIKDAGAGLLGVTGCQESADNVQAGIARAVRALARRER